MEDLEIRKEFAKAFKWYTYEKDYGYSRREEKLKEPTWSEIFIEIGRLLEKSSPKDYPCYKDFPEETLKS